MMVKTRQVAPWHRICPFNSMSRPYWGGNRHWQANMMFEENCKRCNEKEKNRTPKRNKTWFSITLPCIEEMDDVSCAGRTHCYLHSLVMIAGAFCISIRWYTWCYNTHTLVLSSRDTIYIDTKFRPKHAFRVVIFTTYIVTIFKQC